MSNLCRKLESDQCKQVLPIAGSSHVTLVLSCFDGGQVPQRCLVSKFMSSIKCFDLLPQVHAQQGAGPFWLQFVSSDGEGAIPYILLPVSQWKPRAEQEPFAQNWLASSELALVWSTPMLSSVKGCWRGLRMNLHAPTPFPKLVKVTLGGSLCRNFVTPQVVLILATVRNFFFLFHVDFCAGLKMCNTRN